MRRLILTLFAFFFPFTLTSVFAQSTPTGSSDNIMGFARAVAIADGSVFIGESANPHQPGIVYIYNKVDGSWSQQALLSAADGEVGDGFGAALSAANGRILVGAPGQTDGRGAAYVFEDSGDSWTQAARIALSDANSEGSFGASVVLHNDHAFIGAPGDDGTGAVYIFSRSDDGSWSQQAHIQSPDTSRGVTFGSAMAFNGEDLLVGAPRSEGGAVYVFEGGKNGDWTLQSTLKSSRVDNGARFGSAISMKGNKALISAPRHASASGIVFIYKHDPESDDWSSTGSLVAYDGGPRYGFGASIAQVESGVWIGAPGADGQKGALYRFEQDKSGAGWSEVSKIEGPDRDAGAHFASTLAVSDDIAVAGMTGADYGAGKAAIMSRNTKDNMWAIQTTVIGKGSSVLEPITGGMECSDGTASVFGCNNVNLLSFMPTQAIGGPRGVRLNDIWGWTDPETGKEYALVGRMDGTSFVDVSNPTDPVYVATLPKTEGSNASAWRDIKVYENHAYVVADNAGEHGVQVVDLTDLREFDGEPLKLEEVAHYDGVHSVHNIVINTDTGFAYAVGSSGGGNTCGGGLHMINIQDPENPTFAGCFADPSTGRSGTGYTHDAQCVTYNGPDKEHQGDEICFGANETAISIANVTDKKNPKALSTVSYPDYGYVHQGWLTEDQKYFLSNDELDELTGNVDSTRTLVWDVSDLDNPQFVTEYFFDNASSDHNLYIKGDTAYESNYVSGLQLLDVSDPENPEKIGFFDTEPFGKDTPGFAGTWSNYPFFDSDIIIMTSSQEGLFVLEKE